MRLLIKGGRIIDPAHQVDQVGDLFIEQGRVVQIGPDLNIPCDRVIHAAGLTVSPGLVDMHVHLREPGFE